MASTEIWFEVTAEGKILRHVENDGYRFMRRGAETKTTEVALAEVPKNRQEGVVRALIAIGKDPGINK